MYGSRTLAFFGTSVNPAVFRAKCYNGPRRMDERREDKTAADDAEAPERTCPACGAEIRQEKCKVVCRSERCVYRIIFTCSEF